MTEHDQHDTDTELSALYQSSSQEDPPQRLDDAVLAAARRHVKSRPHAISPFSRRWPVSAGLAAVLILSTTHGRLTDNEKQQANITEELIRISVGLEDIDDVINDINKGL